MGKKTVVKRSRKFMLFAGIVILLAVMASLSLDFFSAFLMKTQRTEANTLLIEGWLRNSSLAKAAEEFKKHDYDFIITTGNLLPDEYELDQNGYLIFYIPGDSVDREEGSLHIGVKAYSSIPGDDAAHFNFWINDSLAGDFKASGHAKKYEVPYKSNRLPDSVMIQFDNDRANYGDRNLFVTGLYIGNVFYRPYTINAAYDIGPPDGIKREERNSESYAGLARSRLAASGIAREKIISVPGIRTDINRTYHSILSLRDWLETSGADIRGINVITDSYHSRRTWLTCRKVLEENRPVGVIAIPPEPAKSRLSKNIFIAKQAVAYIYYKFLLLPVKTSRLFAP